MGYLGFEGKVALVTGGNSGLGRATAIAFAEAGAKVAIAARDIAKCEETVSLIKQAGGDCIYIQTDVAKPKDVEAMVKKTLDVYGRLDCAVNNAGHQTQNSFGNFTEEEWDRTMDLNFKGLWMCMKHEIPAMLRHGGGAILNVASTAGLKGFPLLAPYVGSKHGVVGLTRSSSVELARQGIRVNTICPGTIMTPMLEQALASNPENVNAIIAAIPMGRWGKAKEFADAAVWLCSDRSSYITGIALSVDGGLGQH